MCVSGDTAKDFLQREVEILRTKNHWRKAYFYLWDEVRTRDEKLSAQLSICSFCSGWLIFFWSSICGLIFLNMHSLENKCYCGDFLNDVSG